MSGPSKAPTSVHPQAEILPAQFSGVRWWTAGHGGGKLFSTMEPILQHYTGDDSATEMDYHLTNTPVQRSPNVYTDGSTSSAARHIQQNFEVTPQRVDHEAHSNGSRASYSTLQPYNPPSRGRQRGQRGRRRAGGRGPPNQMVAPQLLPGEPWQTFPKHYLVKARDGSDLGEIDTILAAQQVNSALAGKPKRVTETRAGALEVEVVTERQGEALRGITSLAGVEVVVELDEKMNQSKGTIWYKNKPRYDEQRIRESLAEYKAADIYRITKKEGRLTKNTNIYIVTFNTPILPEEVIIGFTVCHVKQYIPRPRRCFRCHGYGHSKTKCREEYSLCANCAKQEHGECLKPSKCINCGGNHSAASKNCATYLFESEVLATQANQRIPLFEARRQVAQRLPRPRRTYAAVLRQSRPTPNFEPLGPAQEGAGAADPQGALAAEPATRAPAPVVASAAASAAPVALAAYPVGGTNICSSEVDNMRYLAADEIPRERCNPQEQAESTSISETRAVDADRIPLPLVTPEAQEEEGKREGARGTTSEESKRVEAATQSKPQHTSEPTQTEISKKGISNKHSSDSTLTANKPALPAKPNLLPKSASSTIPPKPQLTSNIPVLVNKTNQNISPSSGSSGGRKRGLPQGDPQYSTGTKKKTCADKGGTGYGSNRKERSVIPNLHMPPPPPPITPEFCYQDEFVTPRKISHSSTPSKRSGRSGQRTPHHT